ncbi:LVIVD repeat-containing protein [Rubrivirga sp. IMCC45206]|uniref:LVIVD repeat-containing protein n=1 Tax=Rubrivirga sp. IMCC45206 TaxID=3391614 RepID=UPI00399039F9
MRLVALAALAALLAAPAGAQQLDLIGTVELPTIPRPGADQPRDPDSVGIPDIIGGSDVWAYTANDGAEYAIMGNVEGIAIVAVPSLEVVAQIPGPTDSAPFYWRDIKTYGSFAYIATEALGRSEGLQVIDLRGLPHHAEEIAVVRGENDRLVSSHNLSIDTATGYAYMLNSDANGIVVINLADPIRPVDVAEVPVPDSHDIFARNDTLYVAEGRNPTFSMWDMTDKAHPTMIGRVDVPAPGYVHNIWPSADGRHAMTTEETVDKTVKVWDLSDAENPTLVGDWLGTSRLAHNVQIDGDYAFVSHYASGVYVLDISDIANPVEVARFDTHADNDDAAFYGNWGVSLPSPGGYLYASDLEGTLTVLKWDPKAPNL